MTYEVERAKIEIQHYVRHDVDAILSFRVALEPITVICHTHIERIDFFDGYLTIVTISYATTPGVRVSLTWM